LIKIAANAAIYLNFYLAMFLKNFFFSRKSLQRQWFLFLLTERHQFLSEENRSVRRDFALLVNFFFDVPLWNFWQFFLTFRLRTHHLPTLLSTLFLFNTKKDYSPINSGVSSFVKGMSKKMRSVENIIVCSEVNVVKERELRQRKYSKSSTIFIIQKRIFVCRRKVFLRGALDFSTNPELHEFYDVVGLLYPGGNNSRVLLLDQCRLCRSGLESP